MFDAIVNQFCATHPSDPFCSCHLKPPSYTGKDTGLLTLLNAPQCYDPVCIASGYETSKQISFRKTGSCPTSICSNSIQVGNITNSDVSKIIATCDSNSSSSTTSVPETKASNPKSPANVSKTSSSVFTPIVNLLFVLFFIMVAVIGYLFSVLLGPSTIAEDKAPAPTASTESVN
jgi:hypothetical protein